MEIISVAKIQENSKRRVEFADISEALIELTYDELVELDKRTRRLLEGRRQEAEDQLRIEFQEKAAKLGVDPATFFSAKPKKRTGKGVSTMPPKYIGPYGEEYSGKGRMAGWLQKLVDSGKNPEDFINPEYIAATKA